MPFTPAHPAAVIPIRRWMGRYAVTSALVVGSLMPDFVYLDPERITRPFTHGIPGLFLFCIPLGLLVLLIFQHFLKAPFIHLMPYRARRKLVRFEAPLPVFRRELILPVILSLAAGALSHDLWDQFTHEDTLMLELLPLLNVLILKGYGPEIRIYSILQGLSSVGGIVFLLYWSWQWLRRQPEEVVPPVAAAAKESYISRHQKGLLLAILILLPAAFGFAAGLQQAGTLFTVRALRVFARNAAVGGLQAFGLMYLTIGIYWKWRSRILVRSRFRGFASRGGRS